MIGNESWLNPNIYSSEEFPSEYNVLEKIDLMVMEECLLLATITDFISSNI